MNPAILQVTDLRFLENGPYSFTIYDNEIFGLCGESGIGKSQLLRAIVECINFRGSILYRGVPPENFTPSQWRRTIALIPAESQWWRESVAEHFPDHISQDLLHKLMIDLGFAIDVLSWKVENLSTGERQRLALARALVLNPSVVLLDEPCSALDARSTTRVEKLLVDYKEKPETALVWVSHDDEQLRRVASRCFQVHKNCLEVLWQHQ